MPLKARKKVVVFGFKDTFCGQIVNSKQFKGEFEIMKILAERLPNIDEVELHKRNPVKTCEYVRGRTVFGTEVLAGEKSWEYLKKFGDNKEESNAIFGVFILEDNLHDRKNIYEKIKAEFGETFKILNWISETAVVDESSKIGEGSIITQNCYIGYKAEIGNSVLMQTGGILEHHSRIGDFVNICPAFTSGSFVNIEDEVQINIDVTMFNRVSVGTGACLGAGSLVTKDCEEHKLYFGRPAKYKKDIKIEQESNK